MFYVSLGFQLFDFWLQHVFPCLNIVLFKEMHTTNDPLTERERRVGRPLNFGLKATLIRSPPTRILLADNVEDIVMLGVSGLF